MIALDFFTQWMITASVGAACLIAATILGLIEQRAARKRAHHSRSRRAR